MEAMLALGYPLIIATRLTPSFMNTGPSGKVLQIDPSIPDQTLDPTSGHCMLIMGYDHDKRYFIVRNSWSDGWGASGYCYFLSI